MLELIGLIITIPIGIVVGAGTIGLGIKWGGTWLLRALSNDPVLKRSLKGIFDPEK